MKVLLIGLALSISPCGANSVSVTEGAIRLIVAALDEAIRQQRYDEYASHIAEDAVIIVVNKVGAKTSEQQLNIAQFLSAMKESRKISADYVYERISLTINIDPWGQVGQASGKTMEILLGEQGKLGFGTLETINFQVRDDRVVISEMKFVNELVYQANTQHR